VVSFTDEERDRLPALLFSRQLIDVVFRACRDPVTAVAAARKLTALRRETDTGAHEILTI
jgi:hypothetical protein